MVLRRILIISFKAVGWSPKDKARRLVVISTEEQFHIAGDGLVGSLKCNQQNGTR